MNKYDIRAQLGDGTFGTVHLALNRATGEKVAIKKMKQAYPHWDECLRLPEVVSLQRLKASPHVIRLREVFREHHTLFFVFEFMDGDLLSLIKKGGMALPRVKALLLQILQGIAHIHRSGYMHRDMKPENILFKNNSSSSSSSSGNSGGNNGGGGGAETLKIADFGLVKEVRSNTATEYVSTRWYRAPELLLQERSYSCPIDVFAVACIAYEMLSGQPLFPGSNERDQLLRVFSVLGTPTQQTWPEGVARLQQMRLLHAMPHTQSKDLSKLCPKVTPQLADLLGRMLALNPRERISAAAALQHPFFAGESETAPAAAVSSLPLGRTPLSGVDMNQFAVQQQQRQKEHQAQQKMHHALINNSNPQQSSSVSKNPPALGGGGGGASSTTTTKLGSLAAANPPALGAPAAAAAAAKPQYHHPFSFVTPGQQQQQQQPPPLGSTISNTRSSSMPGSMGSAAASSSSSASLRGPAAAIAHANNMSVTTGAVPKNNMGGPTSSGMFAGSSSSASMMMMPTASSVNPPPLGGGGNKMLQQPPSLGSSMNSNNVNNLSNVPLGNPPPLSSTKQQPPSFASQSSFGVKSTANSTPTMMAPASKTGSFSGSGLFGAAAAASNNSVNNNTANSSTKPLLQPLSAGAGTQQPPLPSFSAPVLPAAASSKPSSSASSSGPTAVESKSATGGAKELRDRKAVASHAQEVDALLAKLAMFDSSSDPVVMAPPPLPVFQQHQQRNSVTNPSLAPLVAAPRKGLQPLNQQSILSSEVSSSNSGSGAVVPPLFEPGKINNSPTLGGSNNSPLSAESPLARLLGSARYVCASKSFASLSPANSVNEGAAASRRL